jgi:UDP-N-acetylglucosamine--N-acetylmuramyl-(pentapeptide) pyrophosphoryl-undecaprenol N-acetylglucosamine transferase
MFRILIAAGGTGGHLFPAKQLAEFLKGEEVHFAGHKLENSPFFDRSFPFTEIASTHQLKQFPKLIKGFWQSIKLIRRFKPDVVVGFGSFHSLPILAAAVCLRKKIVLFEPNVTFGKINRLFAPFAKKIACFFPNNEEKSVYVPFLPWNSAVKSKSVYERDPNRLTILVFGGSQGALFINETFSKAAELLEFPFRVIHLTGKVPLELKYKAPAIIKPFEEDMQAAYSVADIVICRSGAGTIAELISHRKPAVVIPYPYAHDHQRKNGEYLGSAVRLLLQSEATAERLCEEIEALKNNLENHRAAFDAIKRPETTDFGSVVRAVAGG